MATSSLYEHFEKEFADLVKASAQLETIFTDCRWAEGPVWFGDLNCLLWSDIPNDRILRYVPGAGISEFRSPAGNTNGHTRDREGRLVSCSHGNRRVERTEHDGTITVLATHYEGKRLNSPNDVVVKSDGTIWFTDPAYGIESDYEGHKSLQEQDGCHVYRIDPESRNVTRVTTDFDRPNGLAFSPDESILYIADSGFTHGADRPHHIRQFKVNANNSLSGGEIFAEISPGLPDGFRLDTNGNIWTSAGDGVHVYNPSGVLLGKILTPKTVANVTFGGPKRNWLFIAATDSMHILHTGANGVQTP
ncbi:MAG: SMP-30/gluconolactonase/LRE family protein [Hyphomicrobiaceae bacterium]|nr:SMP-30/gluconolactonase/LRE family protein [Hyphomicrobiaceae bacterium]MCC0025126.1 SMP-30/gluconolactonase/LRE family protein [Hyphomicrobiaceae bacterium]